MVTSVDRSAAKFACPKMFSFFPFRRFKALTEETKRPDIYNLTADPSAKEGDGEGRKRAVFSASPKSEDKVVRMALAGGTKRAKNGCKIEKQKSSPS